MSEVALEELPLEGTRQAVLPLHVESVPIDEHCVGDRWIAQDEVQLARLVAIIAMGQAVYAAHLLRELLPASPAFTHEELVQEARLHLTVQDKKMTPRMGYPREQRDGFVFEAVSWIAAKQTCGEGALLKDPHVSATSQGLDGLMIELTDKNTRVAKTTIFEDKCTEDPRGMFRDHVMKAFLDRHANKRSAELVAAASALLRQAGVGDAAAALLSAAVMDRRARSYRASFALTGEDDGQERWKRLFKGYDGLDGLMAEQRIGAGLVVTGELRPWFDALAQEAIAFLDELIAAQA